MAAEVIDRHGHGDRRNKVALYSVNASYELRSLTFGEMSERSSRFADGLTKLGATKGDRIFVYLDRTPQLFIALLGIIKMGGIAGPLFSALGPEATMDRVRDSGAKIMVTSPYLFERIRPIMNKLTGIETYVIMGDNTGLGAETVMFDEVLASGDPEFMAVNMSPEDPYIIHYTSGSTGRPKGILLGHKAMIHQLVGCRYVVDLREDDIYWCTADPGWVTGTSIGILGPWYLGTTIISYEGRFDAQNWYSILEKLKVTVWFTAPTALRMLARAGDDLVKAFDLHALRHICSAGEPLNPEVIRWAMSTMGKRIHDNWWQTETGAPCISNFKCMKIEGRIHGQTPPRHSRHHHR